MKIVLNPTIKKILPLAAAATVTLSTAVASQNKTESTVQEKDSIEYLQADKYEKQSSDRIEAGLTQEVAYKDMSLKAKFDKANLKKDYVISEEEASIYNWSNEGFRTLNDDILQDGLVLRGVDRTVHSRDKVLPHFYIYPEQEYSSLYLPKQKEIFKQLDLDNNQKASPIEVLRYVKTQEAGYYNDLIQAADEKIAHAEKHLDNKLKYVNWGNALFLGALFFLGVACALGSKKIRQTLSLASLAALTAAGTSVGSDISRNNKRFKIQLEDLTREKDILKPQYEQKLKDLNYLDEQLRIENQKL